jgi:aminopeptidase
MDSRIEKLAKTLVNYSCNLKEGEKVLIEVTGQSAFGLVKEIIKECYKVKAIPYVNINDAAIQRELLKNPTEEQIEILADVDYKRMTNMDAYIGIRATENVSELSDIDSGKMKMYMKLYGKVHDHRVSKTKWVVLRFPNNSMAQLANMSLEAFEDFYFEVCNLDYEKMSKAMDNLVDLMNKTDKVRIVSEGTDLTFSIKDIPAIKCAGDANIPDGEVFTAPVKDSINGYITYNTPSLYQGFTYEDIKFEFENGKIVKATANNSTKINEILDSDEGARFVGEFAIGVNPYILKPMKDTLFDEKIMGSFHLTPGKCYDEAPNGNDSSIHWDLVNIQTPEYGGGKIFFDSVLIRENGLFVHPLLLALNPENLK